MSTKQQTAAIALAKLVGKLCSGHEFDDWRQKLQLLFQSCNLDHLLDSANEVAKPKFARPTIEEVRLKIASIESRAARNAVIQQAKQQMLDWKEYEDYRRLAIFTFLLISSTIETTYEAYADVRNVKDQSPAALWKALADRFQPQCASHHVNVMVGILEAKIGSTGISGLIDDINASKLRILASSGSIGDDILKLALVKAIRQEEEYRGHLYPSLCEKFDSSYEELSRIVLAYARNIGNLGAESSEKESDGPRVLAARQPKPKDRKWDRATGGGQRACHKCGSPDHFIKVCPLNNKKCSTCGGKGHTSENCWQAHSKSSRKRGDSDDEDSDMSEDEEDARRKKKKAKFNKKSKMSTF